MEHHVGDHPADAFSGDESATAATGKEALDGLVDRLFNLHFLSQPAGSAHEWLQRAHAFRDALKAQIKEI